MQGCPASSCFLKNGIKGTEEHTRLDFPELGIRGHPPSQGLLNAAGVTV